MRLKGASSMTDGRLVFEWDEAKNEKNENTHGISFEDAILVWADPNSVTVPAKPTRGDLRRYMIIGHVFGSCWSVVHTMPNRMTRRIISARLSTQRERSEYDRRLNVR